MVPHNEQNILVDDTSFWDFLYDPIFPALAAILTIAVIVITSIRKTIPKIKDWNRRRKNDKFFESGEAKKLEDEIADYLPSLSQQTHIMIGVGFHLQL